jgi:hypothetical protein
MYKEKDPEVNDLDGIMGVAMKMEMDLKNKTQSLEQVSLINPLEPKKSLKAAFVEIAILDFYTQVYPDSIVKECLEAVLSGVSIKPPKCVFLPSKDMMQTMIKANF